MKDYTHNLEVEGMYLNTLEPITILRIQSSVLKMSFLHLYLNKWCSVMLSNTPIYLGNMYNRVPSFTKFKAKNINKTLLPLII